MNNTILWVIEQLLSVWLPWMVVGALFLLLLLSLPLLRQAVQFFKESSRVLQLLFVLTILIGGVLRFFGTPDGHRIFFDEDRYLMYAVNFARHGSAVSIEYASPDARIGGDPDPAARITVPVLNAITMKLFGFQKQHLFDLARVMSTLQILLIAVVAWLLTRSKSALLGASMAFAFLPIQVYWSTSANIDSYFVFFALVSTIAVIQYSRRPTFRGALFLIISIFLYLLVRFESFLLLPSLLLAAICFRKGKWLFIDRVVGVVLLMIIAIRAVISLPVFATVWCCAEATPLEVFSLSYVTRNTIPNLSALFVRPEFPWGITVLALYTLLKVRLVEWRRTPIVLLLPWIILYFGIYSFYYAGHFYSYTFSGSYGRFFLMLVPPLVLLASKTVADGLDTFLRARVYQKNQIASVFVIICLSLLPTISKYTTLISVSPWDNLVEAGPRRMQDYIQEVFIAKTPPDATLIIGVAAPVLVAGKTAVTFDAFAANLSIQEKIREQIIDGIPVYMFETNVCVLYPSRCDTIKKMFTFDDAGITDPEYPEFEIKKVGLRNKT